MDVDFNFLFFFLNHSFYNYYQCDGLFLCFYDQVTLRRFTQTTATFEWVSVDEKEVQDCCNSKRNPESVDHTCL